MWKEANTNTILYIDEKYTRGQQAISLSLFLEKQYLFCHKYQKRGLQIQISKNPYQSYYQLNLTVNPQTILHPDNLIWIYNTHTTPLSELFVQVNAMLSFLGNYYCLEHFILKRIDCCVDIDLQNNQTVEEYIRLLKKEINLMAIMTIK